MRLKTRTWIVISLLCFAGAWYFWRLGEQRARERHKISGPTATNGTNNPLTPGSSTAASQRSLSPSERENAEGAIVNTNFPYRLSNTAKGIGELTRNDFAVLLRNALIDTASVAPV